MRSGLDHRRPRNVIGRLPLPHPLNGADHIIASSQDLTSCTESLGFESSDVAPVTNLRDPDSDQVLRHPRPSRGEKSRSEKTKFPPPLSSLSCNGRPSFYLRPVRRGGKLKLTELRIQRPEMLRAHREDGRLRLELVRDDYFCVKEEEGEDAGDGKNQKAGVDVEEEKVIRGRLEVGGGSEGEYWSYVRGGAVRGARMR